MSLRVVALISPSVDNASLAITNHTNLRDGCCYVHQAPHEGHHDSAVEHKFITLSQLGVVKPGPPRLTAFNITGNLRVR
jgi:hypothetical protein